MSALADYLSSAIGTLDSAVDGGLVQKVTIDSALFPTEVDLDRPLAEGDPSTPAGFQWGSLFKPSVRIDLAGGQHFKFEPYGTPSHELGAAVGLGALVVLGLAIYGAYQLTRR
jgi:hypothetical protein